MLHTAVFIVTFCACVAFACFAVYQMIYYQNITTQDLEKLSMTSFAEVTLIKINNCSDQHVDAVFRSDDKATVYTAGGDFHYHAHVQDAELPWQIPRTYCDMDQDMQRGCCEHQLDDKFCAQLAFRPLRIVTLFAPNGRNCEMARHVIWYATKHQYSLSKAFWAALLAVFGPMVVMLGAAIGVLLCSEEKHNGFTSSPHPDDSLVQNAVQVSQSITTSKQARLRRRKRKQT